MFTCVIMALDAPLPNQDKSEMNKLADKMERYLLAIFGTEVVLKIIANGFILHPHSYLRSLWNIIDFVVVVVSIITLPEVVTGSDQVNVKSLRAIRVLRPLKLITGIPSLHVVMTSIMRAVVPLLQVLFLLSFVISIYAIIGLEFMVERFHYSCKNNQTGKFVDPGKACDHLINGSFFVHGHQCFGDEICSRYVAGVNYGITSYDNIFLSILTVFQCVTTEGWSDIMYYTHDVMDLNGYIWSTYYTTLILLGSFFMLNLVLGVLSGEFAKERSKVENRRAFIMLRQDMQLERSCESYLKWISNGEELLIVEQTEYSDQTIENMNDVVLNENYAINPAIIFSSNEYRLKRIHHKSRPHLFQQGIKHFRLKVRNIIKHEAFFWVVIGIVFVNTGIMATYHYREPKWLEDTQKFAEKTFISIFIVELLMKVFALTFRGYCQSSFNVFELIVIILSIVEAFSPLVAGLRVLRCLRLLRVFKITRYWSTLRNLVASLMNAMNSILSLLFLLLLFMLITALLGMQLFSGKFSKLNKYPRTNFDSFPESLLAVFQVITGEDWNTVMYSGMLAYGAPDTVSGILVSFYFLFLVIFGNYTLLNVFLAIAVDNLTNAEILTQDEEREKERKGNAMVNCEDQPLSLPATYAIKSPSKVFLENLTDKERLDSMQGKNSLGSKTEIHIADAVGKIKNLSSTIVDKNITPSPNLRMLKFTRSLLDARATQKSPKLLGSDKMDLEALDKYKSSIQKKWLKIVDYSASPDIFLNSNSEVNKTEIKAENDVLIHTMPSNGMSNDDLFKYNYHNGDNTYNRDKNSFNLSPVVDDDYEQINNNNKALQEDFESQIQNEGFLNMLKINVAQRKRINASLPVLNVPSLFIFSSTNRFRLFCHKIVNWPYFDLFMIAVIVLSSAALSLEDPIHRNYKINSVLIYCDYVFTVIFGLEIFLKVIDTGFILHKGAFLRNSWNKLDTFVFICSLLSIIIQTNDNFQSSLSIKALRVLRVLRPIKAIQKVKKLKIVFQCMVYSLKNVAFVLIITLLMLFIFACIGVQLFQGRYYYCEDESKRNPNECLGVFYEFPSLESVNKGVPESKERQWKRHDSHFDNVFEAILTLYICSTEDNWPTVMQNGMDVTGIDHGPLTKNSSYMAMYFVMFVVIFTFMIINIYIALIILTFQKQGEKQIQGGLDRNQRDCLDYVLNAKPRERFMPKNESSISFRVWLIVDSNFFDYFIMSLIVLNCIQLMMKYNGMSQEYRNLLLSLNIGFTMLYLMEAFLKIIAYRLNYFKDLWNLFDLAVILGGLLDIILTLNNTKVLDPSMFRLFRAARVMKLLRKGSSIRIMLWTFLQSFKALPYVTGLILLMSYVYAVIGMQLFGNIKLDGDVFHDKNNFRNIYRALLLLFRCSTGDNWSAIMYACYDSAECDESYASITKNAYCGDTWLAILYFTSYIFFCMFLLLNLFVAVIMDNFEYLTRDTSILGPHHIDEFVRCWSEFDPQALGKISHDKLYGMMCYLSPPVGFGLKCPKIVAYKRLIRMNMPVNPDGTVSFHTTLLSLVRLGLDVFSKGDIFENNKELKTTIKSLWPKIANKTLDKFFPSSSDEHQMTVGKIFCIKLLVMNFRKSRERTNEEILEPEPSASHTVIQRLQSLIPGFKSRKTSNESCNHITGVSKFEIAPNVKLESFTKAHHEHRLAGKNSILKKEFNRRRSSWDDKLSFFRFESSKDEYDKTIKNQGNIKIKSLSSILIPASKMLEAVYSSPELKDESHNRNSFSSGKLNCLSSSATGESADFSSNHLKLDSFNKISTTSSVQIQNCMNQYHLQMIKSISAPATPKCISHSTILLNFSDADENNQQIASSLGKLHLSSDHFNASYLYPNLNGRTRNEFSDFKRQRSVSDSQRTQIYTNGRRFNANCYSVSDGNLQKKGGNQSKDYRNNSDQAVYDNAVFCADDTNSSNRAYEQNQRPLDLYLHEYRQPTELNFLSLHDKLHNSYKPHKKRENSYNRFDSPYRLDEAANQQPSKLSVKEISELYQPHIIREGFCFEGSEKNV